MTKEVGWAEPECIIGQPRIQKVEGFYYFYLETKHTDGGKEGTDTNSMVRKAKDAYAKVIGEFSMSPLLIMYANVPNKPDMYDLQVGFPVPKSIDPGGAAKVRYVEPTLCVSLLAWGDIGIYAKSYAPLMDFVNENGLKCAEGWREWAFYWEG